MSHFLNESENNIDKDLLVSNLIQKVLEIKKNN